MLHQLLPHRVRSSVVGWMFGLTLMLVFSAITIPASAGTTPPGVIITGGGLGTNLTEGSTTGGYVLSLTSPPTSDVTITIIPDGEASVSPTSVTFTPANWFTGQQVIATAINDNIYEANHTATVTHSVASADANYNGIATPNMMFSISDNEYIVYGMSRTTNGQADGPMLISGLSSGPESNTSVIVIVPATVNSLTPNADATGSYGFDFDFQIETTITGGTATGGGVDYTFATGVTTYTATQSSATPNFIGVLTLDVVNDTLPEGDETVIFSVATDETGTSGSYDAGINLISFSPLQNHTYTILANDNASATVSKTTASVSEAGTTDSYTVVLDNAPSADVTVNVAGGADVAVSPSSLVFTTANWNTPQTVTVSAVNDNTVEGAHSGSITHTVTSADSNYNGLSVAGLSVDVTDNDSASYQFVVLQDRSVGNSIPESAVSYIANVELVFNTNGTGENQLESPIEVPFTVGGTATGGGTDYSFNTGFGICLCVLPAPAPTNSLTIQIDGTADHINVSIVDDAIDEDDETVIFTLGNETGGTSAQQAVVTPGSETVQALTILDNDTAGVTVSKSAVSVTEGGTSDTYTVVLNSQPTANVTVSVAHDTITGDAQVSISPTTLTFTTANWNTPQTVTVTAVDDVMSEGAHTGIIAHGASGGGYDAISIASVTANITDNDIPGIDTDTSGFSDITEGASSSYTVVLLTQPASDVVISLINNAQTDATVSPVSLEFTSANWNSPQTVTVTAINDRIVENSEPVTISHIVVSSDSGYNGFAVDGVSLNITDNDTFAAEFASATSSVNEAVGSTTITVNGVFSTSGTGEQSLAEDKTFSFSFSGGTATSITDYTADVTGVTFSGAATPQTLTITIIDDSVDEADETVVIGLGGDGRSIGLVLSHTLTITDNDSAGVTVPTSGLIIAEGTSGDTYGILLESQPTSDVTITLGFDSSKITVSPTTLTFTSSNWFTPQSVTVTADSDSVIDAGNATITHAATSSDTNYNGIAISSVSVDVIDASIDLLLNGGFETVGAKPKDAANWTGQGLVSTDRRVCKDALEGVCAFRFKSSTATDLRFVRQVINTPSVSAGDTLTFNGFVKATGLSKNTKIWVRAVYAPFNQQKLNITVNKGTYDFTAVTGSLTLTGVPSKIIVTIRAEKTIGTFVIDDVELLRSTGSTRASQTNSVVREGVLGLPEAITAPDGFRSNR